MEAKTAETMKSLAVTTIRSIRQPVATLSGGQRQSVAVARAVMWNSRLVILDEPTAALGVAQTQQVLELVERLAQQGLAVVLISHNLHDIFAVADRITVLRLGRSIAVYERDRDAPSRRSCRRSRPASRRRCPASRRRRRSRRYEQRRRGAPAGARAARELLRADPRQLPRRQPRQLAGARRARRHRHLLLVQGGQLPQPRQLQQHPHADGRRDAAGLRRRLRPPDRRDRPLDQLHQRHRRRRRREADAPGRERGRGDRGDPPRRGGVLADRRLPGLVRRLHRRAGVRRHPRRLPDLAGRDPEVDRGRGRDRDPGRDGEQHRQLLLLEPGRLDPRGDRLRGLHSQHRRRLRVAQASRRPRARPVAARGESGRGRASPPPSSSSSSATRTAASRSCSS